MKENNVLFIAYYLNYKKRQCPYASRFRFKNYLTDFDESFWYIILGNIKFRDKFEQRSKIYQSIANPSLISSQSERYFTDAVLRSNWDTGIVLK